VTATGDIPISPTPVRNWREALRRFNVTPNTARRVRRGRNTHWIVGTDRGAVVLRRYASECSTAEVSYELAVLAHLAKRGWPVPTPVVAPFRSPSGIWCLFPYLTGRSRAPRSPSGRLAEQRGRGRLLARLHTDLEDLADLGQRDRWKTTPEGLFDRSGKASADTVLRNFAARDPERGRVLLDYAEHTAASLAELMPSAPAPIVIHGDFVPWNMRFAGGRLSGLFDFDVAHLDLRIADFALAWRGKHDGVLAGYEEAAPLNDIERALMLPVYWAWMLACAVSGIADGSGDLDWAVSHLLRQPLER
jgi:Ser/Thr protein kinase RdoA (MazF antagonist)